MKKDKALFLDFISLFLSRSFDQGERGLWLPFFHGTTMLMRSFCTPHTVRKLTASGLSLWTRPVSSLRGISTSRKSSGFSVFPAAQKTLTERDRMPAISLPPLPSFTFPEGRATSVFRQPFKSLSTTESETLVCFFFPFSFPFPFPFFIPLGHARFLGRKSNPLYRFVPSLWALQLQV